MRTRWLSPRQASGVAAQVLQSGMLYPAKYDVYDSKDCEEADKVVRGVVFRSLTPHMFVPYSAVHLPMSMGGLGVEVMEDLINRELVTAWARDLESEHTATRETTRHVTRLVEARERRPGTEEWRWPSSFRCDQKVWQGRVRDRAL